jgi:beta-lactamase regulating signal transducer with metallopeptidase domain
MNPRTLAVEALAWLLTYAVHSTLLLAAAWMITAKLARSERAREAFWKLALVGGIATASVQRLFDLEPQGGSFRLERTREVANAGSGLESTLEARVEDEEEELRALGYQLDVPASEADATEEVVPSAALATPEEGLAFGGGVFPFARLQTLVQQIDWTSFALFAWLAGGAAVTLLFALAAARLRDRLAGRSRLREGPLVARFETLRRAAGIRRPVRLTLSPKLRTPVALGTLFPEICLPPRAVDDLGPEEQDAMLAHELAHVARFDPLWLTICRWTETVFFFQPLNRMARARLDDSAEILCDEQAVRWTNNRLGLARCLAEVAGWIVEERRALLACGMAGARSRLSERVTRILAASKEPERAPHWIPPLAGLAFAATVLLAPGFSSPGEAESADLAQRSPSQPPPTEIPNTAPRDASTSASVLAQPDTRDLVARVQAELHGQFASLSAELDVLRHEIDAQREIPSELATRLVAIEERAASMREKKARIDALLSRLIEGNETNTTIDEMDRSQQGGNR